MKALLYTAPYTLEYTDWPEPQVGDDDILVRVKACGICGSDVAGHTGKTGRRLPPLIMGHEAAGVVERTGRHVKGFAPGDRICFDSTVYCNQCPACKKGMYNRCVKRQVLGVSVPEFKRHGAFAEFVAVPHWICAKLPEGMSFVQACLLEPASIGTHAANRPPISKGDTVGRASAPGQSACSSCRPPGFAEQRPLPATSTISGSIWPGRSAPMPASTPQRST